MSRDVHAERERDESSRRNRHPSVVRTAWKGRAVRATFDHHPSTPAGPRCELMRVHRTGHGACPCMGKYRKDTIGHCLNPNP